MASFDPRVIEDDLSGLGKWFGVRNVECYSDQVTMLIDREYLDDDDKLEEVVEWFAYDFLPEYGLRLEDAYAHGDLTIFFG